MNSDSFHINPFFEAYNKKYGHLKLGDFLLYKSQFSFLDYNDMKYHYKFQAVFETIDRAFKKGEISEEEAVLLKEEKNLFFEFLSSLTEEEIFDITLERELLFEKILLELSNSKELKESWGRYAAILEFFKNNYPEFDEAVVSAFSHYDDLKIYKKNWGQLVCLKCRGEWVYEAYKYKKAENAHEFVCASCSGLTDRGDGLHCVDDAVRAHPYQFLASRICVTVAGWISEMEYDSDQYYFDTMEEAETFKETCDVPDGKSVDILV